MHFYTKDAEPAHFVPMSSDPSRTRPTRVNDGRKLGLYPSVTTVLNILDKRALTAWLIDQHLQVAYEIIPDPDGSYERWAEMVRDECEKRRDIAPSAGTDIHAVLEDYANGKTVAEEYQALCEAVTECIVKNTDDRPTLFMLEKHFISDLGFGGCVDLANGGWVIDYKTKLTTDKWKPKRMAYPEHARQLAAYREGLGLPNARCANLFICIETGELDWHEWPEKDLERGWQTFRDCLSIWKRENYDPTELEVKAA